MYENCTKCGKRFSEVKPLYQRFLITNPYCDDCLLTAIRSNSDLRNAITHAIESFQR